MASTETLGLKIWTGADRPKHTEFNDNFRKIDEAIAGIGTVGGGGGQSVNVYRNKKANFMGDSITYGTGTTKVYHEYLREMLGLATVNNYGEGGTTISTASSGCMADRVNDMDITADLIVVFGGTNDFHFACPIGEMYTTNGAGLITPNTDKATFYGALNVMCQRLLTRYSGKQCVLMTPLHRYTFYEQLTEFQRNAANHYVKDYVDAVIKIGEFYGIPVLDLWGKSGLNPTIDANATLYFAANDKLHPNANGHQVIAEKLAAFLSTLNFAESTDSGGGGNVDPPEEVTDTVSDTFDRADNATALGSTQTGQTWTAQNGVWGISNNRATLMSGNGERVATIDSGVSDGAVSAAIYGAVEGITRLIVRYTDLNNYVMVETVVSGFKMYKREAGGWVELGSADSAHTDGDILKVVLNGASITVFVNDVLKITATDAHNQTATKHGLGISSGGTGGVGKFDNFKVS